MRLIGSDRWIARRNSKGSEGRKMKVSKTKSGYGAKISKICITFPTTWIYLKQNYPRQMTTKWCPKIGQTESPWITNVKTLQILSTDSSVAVHKGF